MKAAVFLERDGVINEAGIVGGHQEVPLHLDGFQVCKEVRASLERLKNAGFLVIVTTNQPGLADGRLCRSELDLMHSILMRALPIDDILMCPHAENDNCHCHKPEAGLFTEANFKWNLDMDLSFVISNKWQDAAAAHVAGCTSVLIKSALNGDSHHDFIVPSLPLAVDKILSLYSPKAEPGKAMRAGH
jgi:D-glycero-D-manno-heptose 1,7-bisphosphate phosphatase